MASQFRLIAVAQMTALLDEYERLYREATERGERVPYPATVALQARFVAAIERFTPQDNPYRKHVDRILAGQTGAADFAYAISGVLSGLKDDYQAGAIGTFVEIVHGDVFTDFLEMADHLDTGGFPIPAAVIAGTVLEEHIRKLCNKCGVSVVGTNGKARSVNDLNVDLVKKSAYAKPMQMQVQAWYALRNSAAHGKHGEYKPTDVAPMIAGIRTFIAQYPA